MEESSSLGKKGEGGGRGDYITFYGGRNGKRSYFLKVVPSKLIVENSTACWQLECYLVNKHCKRAPTMFQTYGILMSTRYWRDPPSRT